MKFFDDIALGERHHLGTHRFTADEIKRFAGAYDPQPFHTDEAAAAASHFGALCASGWHTMAVWMKMNVEDMNRLDAEQRGRGEPCAEQGPSPGFDDLKWLRPVYAGDTISFDLEVVGARASRSRPGWGLISTRNTALNQHGEPVMSFTAHVFIERRGTGVAP